MALASAATAGCSGATCTLGGQLRAQIGNGLPIPITIEDAPGGYTPNDPTADLRWGQPGGIKATAGATIMQQSPAPGPSPALTPRSLMISKAGVFTYHKGAPAPVGIGVLEFNAKVLSVKTNLMLTNPHPGTTVSGATTPDGPFAPITLKAGGRSGPTMLTWCVGMPFNGTTNPGCKFPNAYGKTIATTTNGATNVNAPPVGARGLVRYKATGNQFGGTGGGRTLGTAMVYFNVGGLALGDLPCEYGPVFMKETTPNGPKIDPNCKVGISDVFPGSGGVNGGQIGNKTTNSAFTTPTGVFTADLRDNGQVIRRGYISTGGFLKTKSGAPSPFTGQAATSWGFPATTGKMTISVTTNEDAPTKLEIFKRTGGDNRTKGGQGIVVTVSGAISSRQLSGPNGNRGWATYNVPEPSAILAASAGLLGLFGCHQLVRRRRR
jgi:hypothetical protein